jgi:hypothetical protein
MASSAPASKPFSLSLGPRPIAPSKRKEAPSKSNNKRSLAALGGDDSDDETDNHHGKVQRVSGFDHTRGGALDASGAEKPKKTAPLVIPALQNRDWKREAELRRGGRKALYIPEEAKRGAVKEEADVKEVENTGEGETYGLQTFEKSMTVEVQVEADDAPPSERKELTEDERAVAALMGADKKESGLVIAHTSGTDNWRSGREDGDEDDAYKKDVESRPDIPTLEDYAAVPVEDFGAALLRGMGWKGGEELGRKGKKAGDKAGKLRLLEKRPAFLGIGAKPMADIPELGSWGSGDKKKGRRPDTTYIPIVKIDKKTGKLVDEKQIEEKQSNRKSSGLEGRNGSGDRQELSRDRSGRGRDDGGRDGRREGVRDKDSRRRDEDSDRRRHRDRSSDRFGRDKNWHRDNGRGHDRDRDREHRKDRDSGRDNGRRRRSRGRDYERRDRR